MVHALRVLRLIDESQQEDRDDEPVDSCLVSVTERLHVRSYRLRAIAVFPRSDDHDRPNRSTNGARVSRNASGAPESGRVFRVGESQAVNHNQAIRLGLSIDSRVSFVDALREVEAEARAFSVCERRTVRRQRRIHPLPNVCNHGRVDTGPWIRRYSKARPEPSANGVAGKMLRRRLRQRATRRQAFVRDRKISQNEGPSWALSGTGCCSDRR